MLFVGIDLSARRGFDVAILDDARRVVDVWRAPNLDGLCARLDALSRPFVAAVDAPWKPSDFPLRRAEVRAALPVPPPEGRYARYRVCDYELARRGIPLYLLPEPGMAPPGWMTLGFETFERLEVRYALRLPVGATDNTATLVEIYPYAGFVTLLGGCPPRKTTAAGSATRLSALRDAGLHGVPDGPITHDATDALCAAYTAWAWRHGVGGALGLADEGLIALPIPVAALRERYRAVVGDRSPVTGRYEGP